MKSPTCAMAETSLFTKLAGWCCAGCHKEDDGATQHNLWALNCCANNNQVTISDGAKKASDTPDGEAIKEGSSDSGSEAPALSSVL